MRRIPILAAVLVLGVVTAASAGGPKLRSSHKVRSVKLIRPVTATTVTQGVQRLQSLYTAQQLEKGVYVGAEFCLACHNKPALRNTKHFEALRRPMVQYSLIPGRGVVADYDQNGVDDFEQRLDFNTISSVFDPYKPNAPILSVENGTYYITIGQDKMPVVCTQGGTGDWKQRFLVRVPLSDTADGYSIDNYVSPIQFNEKTHQYVLYHADAWYDGDDQPKFSPSTTEAELAAENSRQYSEKCIGCHTTGIKNLKETASGEWMYTPYVAVLYNQDDPSYFDYDHDGNFDIVNIQCEACHGPGSAHILGGGDPSKIINPSKLTPKAQNEICAQCHLRVKSTPNGTHDWPYNDATNTQWYPGIGQPLSDFWTDAAGYWPDGKTSRQHHQQFLDFSTSAMSTSTDDEVTCITCHDAHGSSNEHMIVEEREDGGLTFKTAVDDNTLCLSCHADDFGIEPDMVADYANNVEAIGEAVRKHTHHPYAPDRKMGLSRCTTCHMPKVAKSAINFDIHSHTFEAIPPEKTLAYQDQGGMPNSCAASCHSLKVNLWGFGITPDIGVWNSTFEVENANELMKYYGPSGAWWDTNKSPGQSQTEAHAKIIEELNRGK